MKYALPVLKEAYTSIRFWPGEYARLTGHYRRVYSNVSPVLHARVLSGRTPPLRPWLFRMQGGKCYICREDFGKRAYNFDHVVPRASGGKDAMNRLLAHNTCNSKKDSRDPTQDERDYLFAIYSKYPT